MITELYQRSDRDWAVYVGGEYRGTVSKIGDWYVATHTIAKFEDQEKAVAFLERHDAYRPQVDF